MRNALFIIAGLLVMACAGMSPAPDAASPILERTILDDAGKAVGTVKVSLDAKLVSRGCIALDISPQGQVGFILQQDGSGDWSTVRGIASIAPETVAVAMNPVSTPIAALVEALTGRPTIPPPSEIHGCAGLFEAHGGNEDERSGTESGRADDPPEDP